MVWTEASQGGIGSFSRGERASRTYLGYSRGWPPTSCSAQRGIESLRWLFLGSVLVTLLVNPVQTGVRLD